MTYEITTKKHPVNGWECVTKHDMGPIKNDLGEDGRRVLELSTRKGTRGIHSSVSVYFVGHHSKQHVFGMGCGGDFSKQLINQPGARGTEKAIKDAHNLALLQFAAAITEAANWYAEGKHKF